MAKCNNLRYIGDETKIHSFYSVKEGSLGSLSSWFPLGERHTNANMIKIIQEKFKEMQENGN